MSHYIEKRRRRWYAILYIPEALRSHFGKTRFKRSLDTESQSLAQRRALIQVAEWKREIERAGAGGASPLITEAEEWKTEFAEKPDDEWLPLYFDDRFAEVAKDHPAKDARLFWEIAKGQAVMVEPLADKWLAEAGYAQKAEDQHRSALALLFARHKALSEVTRRSAADFVSEVLSPGRSPSTVSRMLSTYSQLWKWMERRGHCETGNPWTNQRPSRRGAAEKGRTLFTEDQAAKLLAALDGVDLDVSRVMAVTGMRLEEVTALTPDDVTIKGKVAWLNIRKGKTKAAARRVPVVAASVHKMLAERKSASAAKKQAHLFHELKQDRYGKLSSALSKRIGRRLRAAGMTDKALVAGHSWRHRARTLMEHAGVDHAVADAVMGHARPGEGLGRYSKGPSEEQLVGAVRTIKFP